MALLRHSALLIGLLALVSCGEAAPSRPVAPKSHAAAAPAGKAPVLSTWGGHPADVNDPPAVRRALARQQAQALVQLRTARRVRPSAAVGCQPLRGPFRGTWGPPAPRYRATVLGHQVAVEFVFDRMPSSPACKPFGISAAVFSGRPATSGYNALGALAEFRLVGRSGRFVVPLPGGDPPYHVGLYAVGIAGARSNQAVLALPCQGRCLPPGPPRAGLPTPILAPRGLTRASLARSLGEAVAHPGGFARATAVSCTSLRVCEVAWRDSVEHSRFTQRYVVSGERVRGCWIAQLDLRTRGPVPHVLPTVGNPYHVGGCVRWPA